MTYRPGVTAPGAVSTLVDHVDVDPAPVRIRTAARASGIRHAEAPA